MANETTRASTRKYHTAPSNVSHLKIELLVQLLLKCFFFFSFLFVNICMRVCVYCSPKIGLNDECIAIATYFETAAVVTEV